MPYDMYEIGDTAWVRRTFTASDVVKFGYVIGNTKQILNKREIVPVILVASLISNLLGMKLPGPGSSVELNQTLEFSSTVYIGETITAQVEVIDKNPQKRHLILRTTCTKQGANLVMDGIVSVKLLEKKGEGKKYV